MPGGHDVALRARSRSRVALLLAAAALLTGCHAGAADDGAPAADPALTRLPTGLPSTVPPRPPVTRAGGPDAGASSPALARFYRQRPQWAPCGPADAEADADLAGLACATVTVPLDYRRPGGRTIRLALDRAAATGGPLLGTLVVNPGGPGASGVDYLPGLLPRLPAEVRRRFDVVGFDPRGTGRSAPVDCVDDAALDRTLGMPPAPRTAAEVRAQVDAVRTTATGCGRRSGRELPYVGTAYAARDLDVIRAVLGERRLTYLGKSYGTLLGATYADTFPGRVRALVLDGAVDPTVSAADTYRQQAVGFETDLRDFVRDCAGRDDCPLGDDERSATRRLDRLLADLRRDPLPAPDAAHGPLTLGYATTGIVATLYSPDLWRYLRVGLAAALRGDGSVLMQLADAYDERRPDGSHGTLVESFFAITCADGGGRGTVAAAAAYAREWAREAPHFGPQEAWTLVQCAWWPAPPTSLPRRLRARGAPPILVVGTTRDPATPYAWAEGLAGQLSSGRLLGFDGDGHTAYATGRSDCVDRAVDAYLLRLRLPAPGTVCS